MQDRYVTGSDAVGLTMGYYDTTQLPIWQYLHSAGAPNYVIADNFFQGALRRIVPEPPGARCCAGTDLRQRRQERGDDGMLDRHRQLRPPLSGRLERLPEHLSALQADRRRERRRSSPRPPAQVDSARPAIPPARQPAPAGTLCGDYAVNTIQPFTQPYSPGTAVGQRLPLLTSDNIGDEMSARARRAGPGTPAAGTTRPATTGATQCTRSARAGRTATGTDLRRLEHLDHGAVFPNCPDTLFQFHHQPFGYFANYADGTQGRVDHLKDEQQFVLDAQRASCRRSAS